MKFKGLKVAFTNPLGDPHTTYYQVGDGDIKQAIERDVTKYGLKAVGIEAWEEKDLILGLDEDLVVC